MAPHKHFLRTSLFLGGAFILLGGFSCLLAGAEGKSLVLTVTESNFSSAVLDSKTPVLVDFWATWCGPCRIYGPIVDQLASDYKGRLKVIKVDVDNNPALSRSLRIRVIPSSFLFQKGKMLRRWVGVVSEADLKNGIDEALKPQEANP